MLVHPCLNANLFTYFWLSPSPYIHLSCSVVSKRNTVRVPFNATENQWAIKTGPWITVVSKQIAKRLKMLKGQCGLPLKVVYTVCLCALSSYRKMRKHFTTLTLQAVPLFIIYSSVNLLQVAEHTQKHKMIAVVNTTLHIFTQAIILKS